MTMQTIDMEYKPWGGLAGMYHGIQSSQIEQSNEQALERQSLENIVKQKEAALAQDEMNNQGYRDWRMKGMIGDNQKKSAEGQEALEVVSSKIAKQISENKSAEQLAHMTNVARTLEQGLTLVPHMGGNWENFVNGIGDPKVKESVVSWLGTNMGDKVSTPQGKAALGVLVGKQLESIRKAMLIDPSVERDVYKEDRKRGQKMEETGFKEAMHNQRTQMQIDAQRAVAGMKSGGEKEKELLLDIYNVAAGGQPVSKFGKEVFAGKTPEQMKLLADEIKKSVQDTRAAGAVKGKEDKTESAKELWNMIKGGDKREIEAIKNAWGAYEPHKYEYRKSETGELQRKLKGSK